MVMFLPYGDRFLPLGTKPAHAACYCILGGYPPVEVFLPYGGMAPLGRRPFPRMMPKEIACLFRRVIRRLSACRRVYILMGKRKARYTDTMIFCAYNRNNSFLTTCSEALGKAWRTSPKVSVGIPPISRFLIHSLTVIWVCFEAKVIVA